MDFKAWLEAGGGLVTPLQRPETIGGAYADYHDDSNKDPKNPNGKLPLVKKKKLKTKP